MKEDIRIRNALISCYDKTGIDELAKVLRKHDVRIISSGGTAEYLEQKQIPVTRVDQITGFPEMLEGRVKTLHPMIHGAILAKRTPEHLKQLENNQIQPIDLVVVNLYPFVKSLDKAPADREKMIELIDIGGPAMLRAAAKNNRYVVALHHPSQYREFIGQLESNKGSIPATISRRFAARAFFYTSYYDSKIAAFLFGLDADDKFLPGTAEFFVRQDKLRYGENPHQQASLYKTYEPDKVSDNKIAQYGGKEMSFNNYVDVSAAFSMVREFKEPAIAIIKHTNPCGAAEAEKIVDAFERALATDPLSAFGGIIASNRGIDADTARLIIKSFYECVIAPGYDAGTIEILKSKKNLRILEYRAENYTVNDYDKKYLETGLLIQDADSLDYDADKLKSAADRKPDETEMEDLLFAWKIAKHVKSNAIVFVKNRQLLGVGAGQMSRVDAVKLAHLKASEAGHDLNGAVMASDAFFPFRDGVDEAAKAGIRSIIQPGGSIRDKEVIEAVNEHKMAMLLTGVRHFKH